jgi:D-3-phosphoglycerate dehydrogenase
MSLRKNKIILSITPIAHIKNVENELKKNGKLKILQDPSAIEVKSKVHKFDAIFTNPNKSKVFIGKSIIDSATNLKVISTASTGTNHIDLDYAKKKKIKIISLKKEKKIINKISSTAEHALALTLASLRNVTNSSKSVLKGEWDYTKFIGRQMDHLTIGIIGYGRLGKKYAKYCKIFGSKVIFFDPFKKSSSKKIKKISYIKKLLKVSDIISIHVHLNKKTHHMFNKSFFSKIKKNVIIINTARGDVIDENTLINFLKKNKKAKFATDVIENEIFSKKKSKLINYAKKNQNQVLITPHIGGMTTEAQEMAYNFAAKKLTNFLKKK